MTDQQRDRAAIIAPPPLLTVLCIAAGWAESIASAATPTAHAGPDLHRALHPGHAEVRLSTESPHTREEIIKAFDRQERDSVAYWSAFDTATFFRRIGSSWSPAETVRHLVKSTRPVAKALSGPSILLRLMFGKPGRPSQSYDDFRARYLKALEEGGRAGRFSPSSHTESDLEPWRAGIMESFATVNGDLRTVVKRWPDQKLDRLQLPHPLLGKLTLREMLFFTLYHHRHHIAVVKRHLSENQVRG